MIGRRAFRALGPGAVVLPTAAARLPAARARERPAADAGSGVLVSLAGDGATAGPPPGGGWAVRVTDWHGAGPEAEGETVRVDGGGVATSSTTVRRWSRGDEEMHHV